MKHFRYIQLRILLEKIILCSFDVKRKNIWFNVEKILLINPYVSPKTNRQILNFWNSLHASSAMSYTIIVPCRNSHAIEKLCNRKLETIQTMLLRKPSFIFICRINKLFVTMKEGRHTMKFISHIDRILCIIYHSNSLFAFLMNLWSMKRT